MPYPKGRSVKEQIEGLYARALELKKDPSRCNPKEITELLERVRECDSMVDYEDDPSVPLEVLSCKLFLTRKILLQLEKNASKEPEVFFLRPEKPGPNGPLVGLVGSNPKLGEEIGRGTFGVVYKADFAGTPVAVKKLKKEKRGRSLESFKAEMELMKLLRHPNFVTYLSVVEFPGDDTLSFAVELCDTDLFVVSRKMRGEDPSTFLTKACKYFCQAARGFSYLHNVYHMVHRDIKPANILLKDDEVKISDFGFTLINRDDKDFDGSVKGSPFYMAPELFEYTPYSYPIDVYAFGITMFEVLKGGDPFEGHTDRSEFSRAILAGERPNLVKLAEKGLNCPESLIELMQKCWDKDAAKRPKMSKVYQDLKMIFTMTVVPETSQAFNFWLKHFGEIITDYVTLGELLKAIPQLSEHYRPLLRMSNMADRVSLKTVDDMFNWYGDILNGEHLGRLVKKIDNNKWFVGPMDSDRASSCVTGFHSRTKKCCFLVRASRTDSKKNPFTITICKENGDVVNFRVARGEDGSLGCTNFLDSEKHIIYKSDIFELIQEYINLNLLKEEPFTPGPRGDY